MTGVIIPYTNPDLDGIACAIALESLEAPNWNASFFGILDQETELVLNQLNISAPPRLMNWTGVTRIWLVDTHNIRQLPSDTPTSLVVRITDHHPDGDPQRFPHALCQNEPVGAAATLVAEHFWSREVAMLPSIAALLQAAIMSNTLEFRAPSTKQRDRLAFGRLSGLQSLPPGLIAKMREAKRDVLSLPSFALLSSDMKRFDALDGTVIVSQIEAPGALAVLDRPDLVAALKELVAKELAAGGIANIVDTAAGTSAVITSTLGLVRLMESNLGEQADPRGIIQVSRILQRKSDIIPYILNAWS